jgi:hypothetical protein
MDTWHWNSAIAMSLRSQLAHLVIVNNLVKDVPPSSLLSLIPEKGWGRQKKGDLFKH